MTTTVQVNYGSVWVPPADFPGTGYTPPAYPPNGFASADPNDPQWSVYVINRSTPPATTYGPGEQCVLADDDAQRLSAGGNPQVTIVS